MIHFTCSQCGKSHVRPETSAGTMVFCTCGQGNRVPWESTAESSPPPPPEAPAARVVPPAGVADEVAGGSGPTLEPMTFDSGLPPVASPQATSRPGPPPLPPYRGEPARPMREARGRGRYRPDPNFCLNHPRIASKQTCADCKEAFCADCVVTFQDACLCGPCKNFRLRTLQAPPAVSAFALLSLLVALTSGPLVFCLLWVGRSWGKYTGLTALVPHVIAVLLGMAALRRLARNPKISGHALAVTGIVMAAFAMVLTVLFTLYSPPWDGG